MRPATPNRCPFFQVKTKLRHAIFSTKKKEYLSAFEPADISEWGDSDEAWRDVYCVELVKMVVDDENNDYIIDGDQIDATPYYYN